MPLAFCQLAPDVAHTLRDRSRKQLDQLPLLTARNLWLIDTTLVRRKIPANRERALRLRQQVRQVTHADFGKDLGIFQLE